jgi:hypothetical protein
MGIADKLSVPDEWHRRLLCPCRERPRGCRAAEQRDELAPAAHSITSSARTKSEGGTSRPRALTILWLITSSYFTLIDPTPQTT